MPNVGARRTTIATAALLAAFLVVLPTVSASSAGTGPAPIEKARKHLKHIVFLIKENRTFDTYFGRFPGADGTRTGRTCDGGTVPLTRPIDHTPDVEHHFIPGMQAVNGGQMNCFDQLWNGHDLNSYVQYRAGQIPAYWAWAKRFT